jgi:hypothetical protein
MRKQGFLPTTKDGWMQFEYTMIGVMVTLVAGAMFLIGMKIGYGYGLQACI